MTTRRRLVLAIGASVLATPIASSSQGQPKLARVAVLREAPPPRRWLSAFEQSLSGLGYVEGRTLALDYRFASGNAESLPGVAHELVKRKADVIVALGSQSARAAQAATTTLPVVFVGVNNPVELGLVSSLRRPGGNLTGFAITPADLNGKRLELLRQLHPGLRRVAVLLRPDSPTHRAQFDAIVSAAHPMRVQALPVSGSDALDSAFQASRSGDGLLVLDDPLFASHAQRVAALAAQRRLPAAYGFSVLVESGGLLSYGADLADLYWRAGMYVHRILRGESPGELPVEQPTKFEMVINLRTAQALGLKVPQSIFLLADRIIE